MTRDQIYKAFQVHALNSVLLRSEDYQYRKICRWFSKTFHTPLTEVFKLSFPFVIQNYYESNLESQEYNEVFDIAIKEYLPELASNKEEEDQAFADSLIEAQQQALDKIGQGHKGALDKTQHKAISQATSKTDKGSNKIEEERGGVVLQATSKTDKEQQSKELNSPKIHSPLPKIEEMNLTFDDED